MAGCLTHQQVWVRGLGNAGEIADIGKKDRDLLPNPAKFGRDRAIDDPLHDIRRDKVRERPNRVLGNCHCSAEFVNLRNMGCHWHIIGRGQDMQSTRLRDQAFQ